MLLQEKQKQRSLFANLWLALRFTQFRKQEQKYHLDKHREVICPDQPSRQLKTLLKTSLLWGTISK